MKTKTAGNILVILGLCLIFCAIGLICHNMYDADQAEQSSLKAVSELVAVLPSEVVPAEQFTPEYIAEAVIQEEPVEIPYFVLNPQIEMLEEEINGIAYVGILEIPNLGLELPVASTWSKPNAKVAPCRYKGSVYLDDMIICAHNFRNHFGRLSTLSVGDAVSFTDMEGNSFSYQVMEFEVLNGTAIEQMESGEWDLTLFTCTAGGKARFTVRCERI